MNDSITLACRRSHYNISIGILGADYLVKFPFDRDFLDNSFKLAISAKHRSWNNSLKAWVVSPEAIEVAKNLIDQRWSVSLEIPPLENGLTQPIEKTFQVDYMGVCKNRGGYSSSYASVNGQWAAEFPEDALKGFFNCAAEPSKDAVQTLYQVLCVIESSAAEQIKSAYRRLARQWHPDVCREDNAGEMFRKINEAYELLMVPEKRKRYDAGLYFERQGNSKPIYSISLDSYRPPLRCGLITAEGHVRLGRFVVSKILKWDDVVNELGQVMGTSWPAGSDSFLTVWCDAGATMKGGPF